MKKKIFALMLSCVMVLSMAACGDEEEGDNPGGGVNVNTPQGDVNVNTPSGSKTPTGTPDKAGTPTSAPDDSSMKAYDVNGLLMNIPSSFSSSEGTEGAVLFINADNGASIAVSAKMIADDIAPTDFREETYKSLWEMAGITDVKVLSAEVSDWPAGEQVSTGLGTGKVEGVELHIAMQYFFTHMDEKTGYVYYYSVMYLYPDAMSDAVAEIMKNVAIAPAE